MADLVAKSACAGLEPIETGGARLYEAAAGAITSLSPRGAPAQASDALKSAHGLAFPAPGRATGREGARALWSGRGQALLIGPTPSEALSKHFVLTDQSDGWACLRLDGEGARDVLARLCPLDLREGRFRRGHSARSLIGHMNASITRVGAQGWMILVFRSMAHSAWHELGTAMGAVAARGRIPG